MIADAISGETAVSAGFILSVLGLLVPAVGAAIVASVTTRSKVKTLEDNIREFQQWRTKLQDKKSTEDRETQAWRSSTTTSLAILRERVSPGRGSSPHRTADR